MREKNENMRLCGTDPFMIDLLKGRFKLDEYDTVIHPFLTLQDFRAGDFAIENGSFKSGWSTFEFSGHICGMKADFSISFKSTYLRSLDWIPTEKKEYWSEETRLAAWVVEITGIMPPWNYEWGGIGTGPDTREDVLGVFVGFKESFNANRTTTDGITKRGPF